jgi:hypothetical protein
LKLIDALWASKTNQMESTAISLYTLVYGKEEKIPISLKLNSLPFMVNTEDAEDSSPILEINSRFQNFPPLFYFPNLFFPFIFPLLYLPPFPFSFLPSLFPF